MPRAKRKTHSFTITVSAPDFLTKREVAREIRTNINEHSAFLNGKPVTKRGNTEWMPLDQKDIKLRSFT